MADVASMLDRLKKRAAKFEREQALENLIQTIKTAPMTLSEQTRLLERIMRDCASRTITPTEANKITKAVRIKRGAQ